MLSELRSTVLVIALAGVGCGGVMFDPLDAAPDAACVPRTCANLGATCGSIPNGCGGTLSCGMCAAGETCGAGGLNRCGMGECTMRTTCAAQGAQCGQISDNCGMTLECGTCGSGTTCNASNRCEVIPSLPDVVSGMDADADVFVPPADVPVSGPDVVTVDGGRPLLVGPETEVEGPITSPAAGASLPRIAFGGGQHFVIWSDIRDSATTMQSAVYGARVRPDGTVLDLTGVRLGAEFRRGYDVAWDGAQFTTVSLNSASSPVAIVVRRVRPDGTVLDPAGRMIASVPVDANGIRVAIGSNGNDSLVVWQSGSQFSAVRVDRAGNPLGMPVQISRDFGGCGGPLPVRVVGDRTNYLVTWTHCVSGTYRVMGRLLSGAGVPQGAESTLLLPNTIPNHATASSGSGYLIVGIPQPPSPVPVGHPVSFLRLSALGAPIGSPTVVPVASSAASPASASLNGPGVAWNGTHYVVGIEAGLGIQMFRVSTDGMLLDSPPRVSVMTATSFTGVPSIASSGGGELLMVGGDRSPGDVYGQRIDGTLSPQGSRFRVSGQANNQLRPTLVGDGTGALALWTDMRRGPREPDLFSTRLSSDGTPLDRPAREVTRLGTGGLPPAPTVAWSGTQSLAVFVLQNTAPERGYDVYGQRIGRDGARIDATPVRLTRLSNGNDLMGPTVIWTGSEFLVAALGDSIAAIRGLVFVRVSAAGVPSAPVRTGLNLDFWMQMSMGRDAVLLTYRGIDTPPRARRFSLTGMPLGGEISLSSQTTRDLPIVSFSNGQWLVAWSTMRASRDIVATRVSDAGMGLDPMGLVLAAGVENEDAPTLAPTPSGWLLSYASGTSLRALRVNATGAVEDPGGIPIATRCLVTDLRAAIVTWGSSGLIAYESCRYESGRVFVRTLGSL